MGIFISNLNNEIQKIDLVNCSTLNNLSLSMIREYHANYKMIGETFSINFTEFEQIFSNTNFQKEFYIWDTDNNGLIDSFELFNGLILFADATTEEKVKFLFDLFDFNEICSLGFYDLCFLIEASISSSLKVHKIGMNIPSEEIEEIVGKFLIPTRRIKLQELKNFLITSPEVKSFLKNFKLNPLIITEMKIKSEEGYKLSSEVSINLISL